MLYRKVMITKETNCSVTPIESPYNKVPSIMVSISSPQPVTVKCMELNPNVTNAGLTKSRYDEHNLKAQT